jgi:NAD(P)-dependent dehydrogenase (short-subunit alcohol dehydrogenase family)
MRKSTDVPIPDLRGKRALVTGASDGIGLIIAGRLAAAGAELVLPLRTPAKGEAAIARLRDAHSGLRVSTVPLDLASLASVREAADRLLDDGSSIDILIANAGIMAPPRRVVTEDGFELQMATNHLGHMALIARLLPLLQAPGTRVTSMASAAAKSGRIDLDDLHSERRYSGVRAYMNSKLAQMLFALELDRRAQSAGAALRSNVAHPGTTMTNLYSAGPDLGRSRPSPLARIMRTFARAGLFVQQPSAGAEPALLAAVGAEGRGGRFYGPDGIGHFTGSAAEQRIYPAATDALLRHAVWQRSVEHIGMDIEFATEATRR